MKIFILFSTEKRKGEKKVRNKQDSFFKEETDRLFQMEISRDFQTDLFGECAIHML